MKRNLKSTAKQRGFTLVEMSVTMAAAGLLFAAVTTGQELIDQAKATKLTNEVKTIEAHLQRYAQLKGRFPGDCNADGVIDYKADGIDEVGATPGPAVIAEPYRSDIGNSTRAGKYSYSVLQATVPADGVGAAEQTDGCALLGSSAAATSGAGSISIYGVATDDSETNANVWINDLKLAGVISDSVQNRRFAKLVNEDFVFVGKVKDVDNAVTGGSAGSAIDANYNAIVLHNVPQWMAIRLAKSINGQDARADRSRVRMLTRDTTDGTYAAVWQQDFDAATKEATRDNMVSVVYYFDRVPESKKGA